MDVRLLSEVMLNCESGLLPLLDPLSCIPPMFKLPARCCGRGGDCKVSSESGCPEPEDLVEYDLDMRFEAGRLAALPDNSVAAEDFLECELDTELRRSPSELLATEASLHRLTVPCWLLALACTTCGGGNSPSPVMRLEDRPASESVSDAEADERFEGSTRLTPRSDPMMPVDTVSFDVCDRSDCVRMGNCGSISRADSYTLFLEETDAS